jgi:transcription antitermination factor NusG
MMVVKELANPQPVAAPTVDPSAESRCFIFVAAPQRERAAVIGLIARRFSAMCPMVYKPRAVLDRQGRHLKDEHGRKIWKKIEEPMFRGYGLITFPKGQERFEEARKVPGVARFVKSTNEIGLAVLPPALVDAIKRQEADHLAAYELAQRTGSDKLKIPFVKGGPARIEGGPYDDLVGKMVKLSKSGRVTLLLSMLGGEVPVQVDGSQVCAA